LLATGGALFLAFPGVLAAGLSGFYLAIFLVLWCLIGRGIAIEFRSHLADGLWRAFWDTVFPITSLLLALLFGVALGNVLRGIPLDADGWFELPLFTDFTTRPPVGILDVYTLAVGAFAVATLLAHGGAFLALRTAGELRARSARFGRGALIGTAIAWPLVTWATAAVRPGFFSAFGTRPLAWGGIALAAAGLVTAFMAPRRGRAGLAFAGTSAFVAGLLAATAVCAYPVLLYAVPDTARSLTVAGVASPADSLRGALAWYLPGLALAVGYQLVIAGLHRGRAQPADYGGH
jgi:cytochrome d ubiquinol oxidase subunit II